MKVLFKPTHYKCTQCGKVFFSRWSGDFAVCGCTPHPNYVDQTDYYTRLGGDPSKITYLSPDGEWVSLK